MRIARISETPRSVLLQEHEHITHTPVHSSNEVHTPRHYE